MNQCQERLDVPTTGNTGKLYPCEAYVTALGKTSKAIADQVLTVSKERLVEKAVTVSEAEMTDIDCVLKVQFLYLSIG